MNPSLTTADGMELRVIDSGDRVTLWAAQEGQRPQWLKLSPEGAQWVMEQLEQWLRHRA